MSKRTDDDGAGISEGMGQVVLCRRDGNGKPVEPLEWYYPDDDDDCPGPRAVADTE